MRARLFLMVWLIILGLPGFSVAADPLFAAANYRDEIEEYTVRYLPHVRPSLIAGQVQQESQWNPVICSKAGACGLLQIMPATGREIAKTCQLPGFDRLNPVHALQGGICYDGQVRKWVGAMATPTDQDTAMLRAFNGGAGFILKERKVAAQSGLNDRLAVNLEPFCRKFRTEASCKEDLGYAPAIRRWAAKFYQGWN